MVDLAAVRRRAAEVLDDPYPGERAMSLARNLARQVVELVGEYEATLAANASLVEINDRLEDEHIELTAARDECLAEAEVLIAERDAAIETAERRLDTIRELSGFEELGRTT